MIHAQEISLGLEIRHCVLLVPYHHLGLVSSLKAAQGARTPMVRISGLCCRSEMVFKETFSVSISQADENLFNDTEVAHCRQWVSGCSLVTSHTVYTTKAKKIWAQETFTYWELNFNICCLANEPEVQVCSLLHNINLESTPDPALH